jgi:hypothetical protein
MERQDRDRRFNIPVQTPARLLVQLGAVVLFCASLMFFVSEYRSYHMLEEASFRLKGSELAMRELEIQIHRFNTVKMGLSACDRDGLQLIWQKVSASFDNPGFFTLIRQLMVLDRQLLSHDSDSVFVLKEMALVEHAEPSGRETDYAEGEGGPQVSFRVEGYLTDICGKEKRWPENI